MNNQLTEWRDIPGYEGLYQASSSGQIKNLSRLIKRSTGGFQKIKERELKQFQSKSGYKTVAISVDGKPKTKFVHRLVASAFLQNTGSVVDHLNGDKGDNRVVNLRFCSQRENLMNMVKKPKSGFTGVRINPPAYRKGFRARIRVKNKLIELGSFNTAFEANRAYLSYKLKNDL